MIINPEQSAEDFYRNYDPMVGVGTALILLLIIFLITIKSLIDCVIRRWRKSRCEKAVIEARRLVTDVRIVEIETGQDSLTVNRGSAAVC